MKNFGVYRYIALIFTLLVVSTAVWGQTTYWRGGPGPASAAIPGNWSAGIPGAGNTAIIDSDAQIEIPGSGTIGTAIVDVGCTVEFIIQAGTLTVETQLQNNGDLTISGPGDLMVIGTTQNANTRTLTIGAGGARNLGPLTNNGTLEVDTASVTCPGIGGPGSVTVSTGTINAEGSITTLAVSGGPATLNGTGAGLTAGGNPGGDIITTGTVTLTGAAFTSITNLGALTLNNPAALSGDMNLTAGSLTLGGDISVGGNWTDSGATFAHNGNAVSFTPTGTSTITGNTSFYDLNCVNQGGETLEINGNIIVTDTLTLTGTDALTRLTVTGTGSIELTDHQDSGLYLTVEPGIYIAGTGAYTTYSSIASGPIPANWYIAAGAPGNFVWTGTTSSNWHTVSNWDTGFAPVTATDKVEIVTAGNLPTLFSPVEINNLTITSGTLTLASSLEANGNLVIGGAGVLDCAGQNLTVAGALNNNGTVHLTGAETLSIPAPTNAATSTVIYEGPGPTTPIWGNAYGNLTIETVSTWTATDGLAIAGTLSVTGSASAFFNNGAGGQTTTAGNVNITSSGTISLGNAAGDQFNCTTGGFTNDAPTTLFGQLTTNGHNITFNASLTIQGASAVSTGGSTGNIEFNNVLEGIVGNTDTLTITAGAGSVLFDDTVGLGEELGSLTVSLASIGITANDTIDAQTVSLTGGTVVLGDTVTAPGGFSSTGTDFSNGGTITTTGTNLTINHTGTITIGAALESGSGDINIDSTGSTIGIGATVTTSTGAITMDADGTTTVSAAIQATGAGTIAFGTTETGALTLSNATPATTIGGNITFNRPVTLTVDAVISTGGAAGGNIAFGAASSINGTFLLELEAGTGTVGLASTVGDTDPLTSLTVSSATTATFRENVTTSGAGIDVTATTINLVELVMTAGSDPGADIDLNGNVILTTGATELFAVHSITVSGTVSGAQPLTVQTSPDPTSAISFNGNVGTAPLIPLGDITIANGYNVTFSGPVNAASLAQSAGSGTTTFVQNVTTSGADGIDITATNITLDGLTIQANGTGIARFNGPVTLSDNNVTINTVNGAVLFLSTVNGAQNLSVTAGTNSTVTFGDAANERIGGTNPLASLTVTGGNITFYGIGIAGVAGVTGAVNVTGAGLAAEAITLYGDHYNSTGAQTWTAPGGVRYRATANGTWSAGGAGIVCTGTDVYLDHDGQTLTLASDLSCRNFYFYRGDLDCSNRTITTTADLVIFGTAYDPNDADWNVANTRHAYFGANSLAYYPNGGGYNLDGTFDTNPNAAFTDLTNANMTVNGNFYVNGTDMNAVDFTLNIPNNDANQPIFNPNPAVAANQWGTTYAVAFNMMVTGVTTNGGWVAASMPNAPDEINNNVDVASTTVGGSGGWQFALPEIQLSYTVYDDVIYIQLNMPVENSHGEIAAVLAMAAATPVDGALWTGSGTLKIEGVYSDPDCATALPNGDIDRFYVRTDSFADPRTWNTDAIGTSAGDGDSTDRSGHHQTVIPNLTGLKGLFRAANGKTMSLHYGMHNAIAFPRFTATTDRCQPVLVQVSTGQELHTSVLTDQLPYDAHNFIELRYSEEVTFGSFPTVADPDYGIVYVKAYTTFTNNPNEWGGAITPAGGGLEIAGYIRTAGGTLVTGTRGPYGPPAVTAPDPTVHALYRNFSLDGAAAPVNQPHRLRISIAGWCEPLGSSFFWQGFITSAVTAVTPSGAVDVLENHYITDLVGNILDHTHSPPGVNSTEADLYSTWDTTPPAFAGFKPDGASWDPAPTTYEMNPLASPGGLVNRIEMHFFDNEVEYLNSENWWWQSRTGWYEAFGNRTHTAPETFGGARPLTDTSPPPDRPTSGGIRDSSFLNAATAFQIQNGASVANGFIQIPNFTTGVNSPFLTVTAGTLNVVDDPYITLQLDDLALGWPIATASIQVTYTAWSPTDPAGGFITDLAGNLLASKAGMQTLDRTPPEVTVSIAGANRDELYLVFSKNLAPIPPNFYDGIELQLLDPPATVLATSVEMPGGSTRVLHFRLDNTITANQLVSPGSMILFPSWGNAPNPDTGVPEPVTRYSDTMGNYVSLTETHRITDIAVGLVDILYASDGVNTDGIFGSNEGALRVFDGSGRLLDRNLTIATHLSNDPPAPLALTMYYDASAPAASLPGLFNSATGLTSRLWLPGVQPGFNTQGNPAARALGADQILDADRLFRNFAISEADEDMVPGSDIDILFRYGDLYCARLEDPADISSVAPWTIGIAETKRQRGGVTILNNVIDSRRRERTIVQVEVPEAGNIVIQVFTLDGNTVKVLERGRKGAGTYQYFWDGTNNGGRPVARGMYFIRVVGPDIDEIRKVMVVKE